MDNHEKSIIEGIRAGSRAAENQFCKVYKDNLESKLRKYCFSTIPVEIVTIDAIIITIEKIRSGKYKHHGKLLPYMIGIGKNLCSEIYKKKIKEIVVYDNMILNYTHKMLETGNVHDYCDEDLRLVRLAYRKLDKICRELLLLAIYKGLKPRKIVQVMPELDSPERISNRKNKCLTKLKEIFNKLKSNQNE